MKTQKIRIYNPYKINGKDLTFVAICAILVVVGAAYGLSYLGSFFIAPEAVAQPIAAEVVSFDKYVETCYLGDFGAVYLPESQEPVLYFN